MPARTGRRAAGRVIQRVGRMLDRPAHVLAVRGAIQGASSGPGNRERVSRDERLPLAAITAEHQPQLPGLARITP